ncbi:MAG TPA: hypothetical protein VKW06_03720 [Candidatus Angelobacter sp.]|nr:hypothetical protein [Candidatus Angelobacter sp.]
MSQTLHIFRKDVRQHWIVILLCQVALLLYSWNVVESWRGSSFGPQITASLLHLLLPLTWIFFILRVVQSESLVGGRQFWVTRPYEWKKLLAEKVLLVVVFLNLPALIAGAFLLVEAGFSPAPHVLGLLWIQLLLFLVPFLPLLALASITRNLIPAVVTLLVLLFLMVGASFLMLYTYSSGAVGFVGLGVYVPHASGGLESMALLFACLVAVVLQYARRRTVQSRMWLIGGLLAAMTISLVSAYAERGKDPFPAPAKQTLPFHAALDPVKLTLVRRELEKDESVPIGIPVSASGIPENFLGSIHGMRLVLEGPRGEHWDGISNRAAELLVPGDNRWKAVFQMNYETYQRLRSLPLKAKVTLSVDSFREQNFETVTAGGGEFEVPGIGRCRLWRYQQVLHCNSPLVSAPAVVLRLDPNLSTCPVEEGKQSNPPALDGLPYAWWPGRSSELPEGGVSPVASTLFYFWNFDHTRICPGTALNFSFPKFSENVRNDFEISDFKLDDYRRPDFSTDGISNAAGVKLGLPRPPR